MITVHWNTQYTGSIKGYVIRKTPSIGTIWFFSIWYIIISTSHDHFVLTKHYEKILRGLKNLLCSVLLVTSEFDHALIKFYQRVYFYDNLARVTMILQPICISTCKVFYTIFLLLQTLNNTISIKMLINKTYHMT